MTIYRDRIRLKLGTFVLTFFRSYLTIHQEAR